MKKVRESIWKLTLWNGKEFREIDVEEDYADAGITYTPITDEEFFKRYGKEKSEILKDPNIKWSLEGEGNGR